MGPYFLRNATLKDAGALADLITQLGFPTTASEMKNRIQPILSDTGYFTVVAERNSKAIGMAGAFVARYYEKKGRYGRLVALIVDRSWRNRGIGSALVGAIENWFKTQDVSAIIVNSGRSRSAAHHFYQQLGFEIAGVRLVKSLHNETQIITRHQKR